jgi:DNA polymerase-4
MPSDSPLTLRSWPNAIIHIDGDAFFASCEQSVHPELKGKPVITGQERNIVASMSYEAKGLGIKRGTALWEARKICPHLIILPSDYETYSLISKRMFSIIRRFTPMVEEASIDEGYADLYGLRRMYRMSYQGIAEKIRDTVERELDIPVSLGLSLNKTLSKLAAKFEKPRGFTVVRGRHIHHFLKQVKVEDVCGIGPNTTALLNKHRIRTAFEYVNKPEAWVKQLLGKIGIELWRELRGELIYELNPDDKTTYQSILKSKTFTPPSSNYNYVKAQLFRNTESAFMKMRRYSLRVRRFVIYLRTQEFKSYAVQSDFNRGITNPLEAFDFIEEGLRSIVVPGQLYRSSGIVLTKLEGDNGTQFELFEKPLKMLAMKTLATTIDEINHEYGKHTVFSGQGLYLKRDPGKNGQLEGRHALAERKLDLLPGETSRQRLKVPLWKIGV